MQWRLLHAMACNYGHLCHTAIPTPGLRRNHAIRAGERIMISLSFRHIFVGKKIHIPPPLGGGNRVNSKQVI